MDIFVFQDPLFVDLLGTCHTETVKPAPLKTSHVKRYRLHVDRGLSFIPPEVRGFFRITSSFL